MGTHFPVQSHRSPTGLRIRMKRQPAPVAAARSAGVSPMQITGESTVPIRARASRVVCGLGPCSIPKIPTPLSLAVIAAILVIATIASWLKVRKDPSATAHAGTVTEPKHHDDPPG